MALCVARLLSLGFVIVERVLDPGKMIDDRLLDFRKHTLHVAAVATALGDMGLMSDNLQRLPKPIEALSALTRPRKVLVHINNTNPILLDDSDQRAAVRDAGVEIGYDGMEMLL